MKTEDILRELIAIRTDGQNIKDNKAVAYICNILEQEHILFKCIPTEDKTALNIIAGINIQELKNIQTGLILSGHIDTVGANIEDWDGNPFEAKRVNDALYGRGTVDMKYFIAAVLSILPEIKKSKKPVLLLFSSDEETTVTGIRELCSFLEVRNIRPQYALIGEPTNFGLCLSNKGYVGYTSIIKGISAHSSCPKLGVNAAYIAAHIISEIEKLNAAYESNGTTLNVGILSGGEGRNSIPSETKIEWEIRYSREEHKTEILQHLSLLQTELTKKYPKAHFSLISNENLPPFEDKGKSALAERAQKILKTKIIALPHATEAGFLQQLGIDVLVCGAGNQELAHSASEHISLNDLEKYTEFLKNLIAEI